jgi:hypothetical protein
MDLKEIALAWTNAIVKPVDVQVLASQRKEICNVCEHKKQEFGIDVCKVCHCPLYAKVYSPYDSCPENKWPR